ncbi:MAG: ROK family transcriptional regulator [Cetobacterium sp.]|uniref:ROK family transcriptional regulator n=1 Tax=Cetobacterium sp. TaxID=2071632 RepID=UPI002FC82CC1
MIINDTQMKILEIVKKSKYISRIDLAKKLNFTPAAISKIIKEFIELGVLKETDYGKSTGGRRPIFLTINEQNFGCILGISFAPSKIFFTVGNIKGDILEILSHSISKNEDVLSISTKISEKLLKKYINISIISLVLNGLVNSKDGTSIFSPHYKWKNIKIKDIFEKKFNLPVLIENDVRAMALAEKMFGHCEKNQNFVLLNISEGIGSSIFLNDDLYSGHGFIAGEIGHIIMDRTSIRKCSCGKRGCLEAEASNSAIINKIISQIKLNNYSFLKETLHKNGTITIEDVLVAVKERDFLSTKASMEAVTTLAHAIDMIISFINPEKIVLVGKIFEESLLLNTLNLELKKVILKEQNCEIVVSKIFDKIHNYSSLAVVIHRMFKDKYIGGVLIERKC